MVPVARQFRQAQPHTQLAMPTLLDQPKVPKGGVAAVMHTCGYKTKRVEPCFVICGDCPGQVVLSVCLSMMLLSYRSCSPICTATQQLNMPVTSPLESTRHYSSELARVQTRMIMLLTSWQLSAESSPQSPLGKTCQFEPHI